MKQNKKLMKRIIQKKFQAQKKVILLSFIFLLSFFLSFLPIEYSNKKNSRKFKFSLNWIYLSYGSSKELKKLKCSESLKKKPPEKDPLSDEIIPAKIHKDQGSGDNEVHPVKNYLIDFAGEQLGKSWIDKIRKEKKVFWNVEDFEKWIHFLKTEVHLNQREMQTSLKNAHVLMRTKTETIFKKYYSLKNILGEKVMKDEIKESTTFYTIGIKNLQSLYSLFKFGLSVNESEYIPIQLNNLDFQKKIYLKNYIFSRLFKKQNKDSVNNTKKESAIKIDKEVAPFLWSLAKSYVKSDLKKHNLDEMTVNEWATKYVQELIERSFYILYIPFTNLKKFIHFLKTNWNLKNEEIFHQVLEDSRILLMTEDQLKAVSHLLVPYAKAYLNKVSSKNEEIKSLFDQNKKFDEEAVAFFHIQSKFKDSIILLNMHLEKTKDLFSWLKEIGLNDAEIYEFIPQMYSGLLIFKNQENYPKQPKMKYWNIENLKNLSQVMTLYAKEFVIDKGMVLKDETESDQEYITAVEEKAKNLVKNIVLKSFRTFDQTYLKIKKIIETLNGKKRFLVNLKGNNNQTIHIPLYYTNSEIFEAFVKHSTEFLNFLSRLSKIVQLTWDLIQHYIPTESDQKKIQNHNIEKTDRLISDFVKNLSKALGSLGFNIKKKYFHDLMKYLKEDWSFKNLELLELMSKNPKMFLSNPDFLGWFFKALHPKLEDYINRRLEFFDQVQKKRNRIINNDRKNSFKKEVVKIIFEHLFSENFRLIYPIFDHRINKSVQEVLDLLEKNTEFLEKISELIEIVQ